MKTKDGVDIEQGMIVYEAYEYDPYNGWGVRIGPRRTTTRASEVVITTAAWVMPGPEECYSTKEAALNAFNNKK